MYQSKEEERLKVFQKIVPNATEETLKVFHDCMKTDAIYKSAIPYGITTAVITHFVTPKKFGYMRFLVSGTSGIIMYIFSKVLYAPICCQKAIALTNVQDQLNENRGQTFFGSAKQEPQNKYFASTDNLAEGEDVFWSNFDTEFDSTSNEFSDINDNMQEELTHEKEKSEKPRVTYDDLWTQHRQQQMKEQYRNFSNYGSSRMSVLNQQKKPNKTEELITSETESEEKNIWN